MVNITEFDLINSFDLRGMFFDAFRLARGVLCQGRADSTRSLCARASALFSKRRYAIPEISCFMRTSPEYADLARWACSGQRRRAVTPDASTTLACAAARAISGRSRGSTHSVCHRLARRCLAAIVVLIATALNPGNDAPPVERIAITRVDLRPDKFAFRS